MFYISLPVFVVIWLMKRPVIRGRRRSIEVEVME